MAAAAVPAGAAGRLGFLFPFCSGLSLSDGGRSVDFGSALGAVSVRRVGSRGLLWAAGGGGAAAVLELSQAGLLPPAGLAARKPARHGLRLFNLARAGPAGRAHSSSGGGSYPRRLCHAVSPCPRRHHRAFGAADAPGGGNFISGAALRLPAGNRPRPRLDPFGAAFRPVQRVAALLCLERLAVSPAGPAPPARRAGPDLGL
ncbi:hypothetical protein SDC9_172297 [bioreactor metagenome]|uniref:Uncharacterized protein n=1 Tax=bioreactor metagenome TaxID=1076179 RepID=A0A645GFS4_9ZZZZ